MLQEPEAGHDFGAAALSSFMGNIFLPLPRLLCMQSFHTLAALTSVEAAGRCGVDLWRSWGETLSAKMDTAIVER